MAEEKPWESLGFTWKNPKQAFRFPPQRVNTKGGWQLLPLSIIFKDIRKFFVSICAENLVLHVRIG